MTFDGVEVVGMPMELWQCYGKVYRWLSNKKDFFVPDSLLRHTPEMLESEDRNRGRSINMGKTVVD